MAATLSYKNAALFVCDIQTAFRTAIHSFPAVVSTTSRLLTISKILDVPVYVTTQSAAKLGPTVPELDISHAVGVWDKTKFSMALPEVLGDLKKRGIKDIAIVGIESHVCVLQSVLDLRAAGFGVWVIRDAVSSCNKEEVGVAVERMRGVGARVVSSEGWVFEVMGDAEVPQFRDVQRVIKNAKAETTAGLKALL